MQTEYGPYIDGTWLKGGDRQSEPVINPADENTIAVLWHANSDDLDRALNAVQRVFPLWRAVSAYDRAKYLRAAAAAMALRSEKIARTLTCEQGKILVEARAEVAAAIDIIDWAAEEGRRAYGRMIPGRTSDIRQLVMPEPVGSVAAFTPWNFPATTPARKIATALAAGCPVILKAAEETPGTAVAIVEAFAEAGLPAGVLNLVFGVPAEVSETLLASPAIRKISFTGSVPVGKHLAALAGSQMKRMTMELGGHSPAIIFSDADPEKAAKTLAAGKYRNAGQVCIAPSRFYVARTLEDRFAEAFAAEARRLRLGDGLDAETTMGPMANARRLQAMELLVADSCGGEMTCGGARHGNRGFFFEPTVIRRPDEDSRLMRDEPFGPVAPILPFDDFDEVMARANGLLYGLAAYVFTGLSATALAAAQRLEAGMVAVNSLSMTLTETPMGGVKDSGQGYEGGTEGLNGYLNHKYVSLQ